MAFEEETVGEKYIDLGNHIVGPNRPDDPKPVMKYPREMSPSAWAKHMETHLPFCKSCPYWLMGKRANMPHRRSTRTRKLPLMVADYGCLRCSHTGMSIPFIVI